LGISLQVAQEHINNWEKELKKSAVRAYRSKWPKYLFRHEKLENAVKILLDGQLLSRNDAGNQIHDDIAPPTLISRSTYSHQFSRLYFRPKNPTQYHVEGIRQKTDTFLTNEPTVHAPVLIMLVFRASSVLALEDTFFSNGNMQATNQVQYGDTEEFFQKIPFYEVFHDGALDPSERKRMTFSKCAEVLAKSPLNLASHLAFVLCRSEAERKTLLHCVPKLDERIKQKIRTTSELGVFFNDFTYVKEVDVSSEGLSFLLNPRKDNKDVVFSIEILNIESKSIIFVAKDETISPSSKKWIELKLVEGTYQITIDLDGHLAYRANSTVTELPF
jgi:ssDNA thymidine ADP-ribosyltransferase, DarT